MSRVQSEQLCLKDGKSVVIRTVQASDAADVLALGKSVMAARARPRLEVDLTGTARHHGESQTPFARNVYSLGEAEAFHHEVHRWLHFFDN